MRGKRNLLTQRIFIGRALHEFVPMNFAQACDWKVAALQHQIRPRGRSAIFPSAYLSEQHLRLFVLNDVSGDIFADHFFTPRNRRIDQDLQHTQTFMRWFARELLFHFTQRAIAAIRRHHQYLRIKWTTTYTASAIGATESTTNTQPTKITQTFLIRNAMVSIIGDFIRKFSY
jgi:hypothetical protein